MAQTSNLRSSSLSFVEPDGHGKRIQNVLTDNKKRKKSLRQPLNDSKPLEGFFFSSDTDVTDVDQEQQQKTTTTRHSSISSLSSLNVKRRLSSGNIGRMSVRKPSEIDLSLSPKQSSRASFGIIHRKESGNSGVVFASSDATTVDKKVKRRKSITMQRHCSASAADLKFSSFTTTSSRSDTFSQTDSDSDCHNQNSSQMNEGSDSSFFNTPINNNDLVKQKSQPALSQMDSFNSAVPVSPRFSLKPNDITLVKGKSQPDVMMSQQHSSEGIDSIDRMPTSPKSPRASLVSGSDDVNTLQRRSKGKKSFKFSVVEVPTPSHDKRCLITYFTEERDDGYKSPIPSSSPLSPSFNFQAKTRLSLANVSLSVDVDYTHYFDSYLSISDSLPMKMSNLEEKDKKRSISTPDSPLIARKPSPSALANLRGQRQDRITYYMDSDESDYYSDSDSCSDSEEDNYFQIERKKAAKEVERELRLLKQRIKDSQKQHTKVTFATNVFSTEFHHKEVYDRTGFPQQMIMNAKTKKKVSEELYFLNQELFSSNGGKWYPVEEANTV
eukprot:Awhi_evm1s15608